jgi:hypothetical protein
MRKKIKILFVAAEPVDIRFRLKLGKEFREIRNEIELDHRFELIQEWSARARDLLGAIMKYKPDIVHFSGHGNKNGILLMDDDGNTRVASKEALADLFSIFRNSIRLVFLNACYSKHHIEAFKQTIDFTIGMKTVVGDSAAIEFAATFYRALAYGHSVEEAFMLARVPLTKKAAKTPILFKRRGANASESFLALPLTTSSNPKRGTAPPVKQSPISIWIHGWVKRIYDDLPTIELDWTNYFDRKSRKVPSQQIWDRRLYRELLQAKGRIDRQKNGPFIDLRGKLSLTAMLAVGATFPEVGGYRFRTEQPTHGSTALWRSDVKPSEREFKVLTEKRRRSGSGKDVLIALSITGIALRESVALYDQLPEIFSTLVYAEPDGGPGQDAIRSDRDAVALAVRAKDLIRDCKNEYNASQMHLVLYAPAAYCLFLGQYLNALGRIVTYERSLNGDYKRSVTLQTG